MPCAHAALTILVLRIIWKSMYEIREIKKGLLVALLSSSSCSELRLKSHYTKYYLRFFLLINVK